MGKSHPQSGVCGENKKRWGNERVMGTRSIEATTRKSFLASLSCDLDSRGNSLLHYVITSCGSQLKVFRVQTHLHWFPCLFFSAPHGAAQCRNVECYVFLIRCVDQTWPFSHRLAVMSRGGDR
jgi:hypothetical protein